MKNDLQDRPMEQIPIPVTEPPIEQSGVELSLIDLAIAFARRKRYIAAWAFGCAILLGIIGFLLPFSYTATTAVLPPQQGSSSGSALLSQLGGAASLASMGSGLSLKNPVDMYVALMKSETVENAVIKRFNLMKEYHAKYASNARKALEQNVAIDGGIKDGIIRISVTDGNAARAAELANGYVDEYRKFSASMAISEASQRRLFFQQQLEEAKDKLADAEEALKLTEQNTGAIQMDSQTRALIELSANLRAQIATKEVQIQSMQTYAASGNSNLIEAQQELAGLRAQLAKLGGAGDSEGNGSIASEGQLPKATLEYVRKLRDVKYSETIFDILARQYEVAKLDEAKEGALIQVIDVATVPDHKSKPHRLYFIVGGFLLGLLIGLLLVFVQTVLALAEAIPSQRIRLHNLRSALRIF